MLDHHIYALREHAIGTSFLAGKVKESETSQLSNEKYRSRSKNNHNKPLETPLVRPGSM